MSFHLTEKSTLLKYKMQNFQIDISRKVRMEIKAVTVLVGL